MIWGCSMVAGTCGAHTQWCLARMACWRCDVPGTSSRHEGTCLCVRPMLLVAGLHWKLDVTEDPSRRRLRLRRNFHFER